MGMRFKWMFLRELARPDLQGLQVPYPARPDPLERRELLAILGQLEQPDLLEAKVVLGQPVPPGLQAQLLDRQAQLEVKETLDRQEHKAILALPDLRVAQALPDQRARREALAQLLDRQAQPGLKAMLDLLALKGLLVRLGLREAKAGLAQPGRRVMPARPDLQGLQAQRLGLLVLRALSGPPGQPGLPLRRGLVSKVIPTLVTAQQRHLRQRAGLRRYLCLFWKMVFRKYQQAITQCQRQILFLVLRQHLVWVSIFVC